MLKTIILIVILLRAIYGFSQFGPQQIISTETSAPYNVVAADIDGDGDIDAVTASFGDDLVAWFENIDGLGSFGPLVEVTDQLNNVRRLSTADLDGDGDIDILATSQTDDLVVWFENLNGLGSFSIAKIITTETDNPKDVIATDIDGDGDKDVVVSSNNNSTVIWCENLDGLGNFGPINIISNQALSTIAVVAADIDGDGDMDVIAEAAGAEKIYWFENLDGLGNFGPEQTVATDVGGFFSIQASDIDGDGDIDIASIQVANDTVAWSENMDGLGTFGPLRIIANNLDTPARVFTADLDNDNDMDVLAAAIAGDRIVWYENEDGLGNFSSEKIISIQTDNPTSVFAADLDNDGDHDVLSVSIADDKIAWYENFTILGVDTFNQTNIAILPNPAINSMAVTAPNTVIDKVVFFSLQGKQVLVVDSNFETIDVSALKSGMYFCEVETEEGFFSVKVLKE